MEPRGTWRTTAPLDREPSSYMLISRKCSWMTLKCLAHIFRLRHELPEKSFGRAHCKAAPTQGGRETFPNNFQRATQRKRNDGEERETERGGRRGVMETETRKAWEAKAHFILLNAPGP